MPTHQKADLLSIGEAAAALGISIPTLRVWADKGYLKTVKLPSGYRRFTRAEIERKRMEMGITSFSDY